MYLSYRFSTKHYLDMHQVIHTGDKPFKCKMCDADFKHISNLKRHQRIHSNAKCYKCRYCTKAFKYINSLQYHEGIHTGDMFTCEKCGLSRRSKAGIRKHVCNVKLMDSLVENEEGSDRVELVLRTSKRAKLTKAKLNKGCGDGVTGPKESNTALKLEESALNNGQDLESMGLSIVGLNDGKVTKCKAKTKKRVATSVPACGQQMSTAMSNCSPRVMLDKNDVHKRKSAAPRKRNKVQVIDEAGSQEFDLVNVVIKTEKDESSDERNQVSTLESSSGDRDPGISLYSGDQPLSLNARYFTYLYDFVPGQVHTVHTYSLGNPDAYIIGLL